MAVKGILWCRQLCSPFSSKQPCGSVPHSHKLFKKYTDHSDNWNNSNSNNSEQ